MVRGAAFGLIGLACLAGCGETAPSIRRGQPLPAGDGILVGKLGLPPGHYPNAHGHEMKIVHVETGKVWNVPFDADATPDDGLVAPFLMVLPAGRYRIASFEISSMIGHLGQYEGTGVMFEVVPGRARCIGALYLMRTSFVRVSAGSGWKQPAALLPRDECGDLEQTLRDRVPGLLHRWEVALAVNESCPPCRADLDAPYRRIYGRPTDLDDVPVVTAESRRVPGPPPPVVRWPPDVDLRGRSLLLRVCTGPEGGVRAVAVLESLHPEIDAQVVAAAKAWRFRPFDVDGVPQGFCYKPRFESPTPPAP